MITVSTFANLQSQGHTDDAVLLQGYYSIGDGGEGIFQWDNTLYSSDDNGGTIASLHTSSGGWKRVYGGFLNAKWFGAIGRVKANSNASSGYSSGFMTISTGISFFNSTDVGKSITLSSPSSINRFGFPLIAATITGYVSPTQITTDYTVNSGISGGTVVVYGLLSLTDGSMSSTSLSSASGFFLPSDVGMQIIVYGAGPSGGNLTTTISTFVSASHVELSDSASAPVTGANFTIFRDDALCIQNAINYANKNHQNKNVFIPQGNYLISQLVVPYGITLFGENGSTDFTGNSGTCLWQMPSSNLSLLTLKGNFINVNARNFWYGTIRDLSLQGYSLNTGGFGISLRSDFRSQGGNANTPTALQDTSILANLAIALFPKGGIELPDGGDPGYLQNIKFNRNGGPGISITGNSSSSVQSMSFINISGDANISGLIYINGYTKTYNPDTFVFVNLKGENGVNNPYSFKTVFASVVGSTLTFTSGISSADIGKIVIIPLAGPSGGNLVTTIASIPSPTMATLTTAATSGTGSVQIGVTTIEQQNFIVLDGGCTAMISIHGACNQPTVEDSNLRYYALGDLISMPNSSNPILFWNGLNLKYVPSSQILVPNQSAPNIFKNSVTGATAVYNLSMGGTQL